LFDTSGCRELFQRFGEKRDAKIAEWEIIGRPYTTNAGKDVHVRVESVKQPGVTEIRRLRRLASEGAGR
jgi:hypothetical protein